jgi:HSP20 family protein
MTRWDPFAEIAWRRESADGGHWFTPVVDIFEEDEAVLVRVELPGVRPEDVRIDARARLLTIDGEREHPCGSFSRTFQLPDTVDGESAIAIMSDGILSVRIPRRCAPESDTFAA